MTRCNLNYKPTLRSVEPFSIPGENGETIGLRDPSGLSDVILSMSQPALYILSKMDGSLSCAEIIQQFEKASGQPLAEESMQSMIDGLHQAKFLAGPEFEAFYQSKLTAYRERTVRKLQPNSALGMLDESGSLLREILAEAQQEAATVGPLRGLVAPHLDYPRGRPCYANAYALLQDQPPPDRVVILGTNHFGRSTSVVATARAFETPLGTTAVDTDFLHQLESRTGPLRQYELDHQAEHSIELQVAWLQLMFGDSGFRIVPFLCPDPCGPTGTAPYNGHGPDLSDFAAALRDLLLDNNDSTLLVAGADLSHFGANFGDQRRLDPEFLKEVKQRDMRALDALTSEGPSAWVEQVAGDANPTRICSAGCIFTLATAIPDATVSIVRYHQAVDQDSQTAVSCAALAFV